MKYIIHTTPDPGDKDCRFTLDADDISLDVNGRLYLRSDGYLVGLFNSNYWLAAEKETE